MAADNSTGVDGFRREDHHFDPSAFLARLDSVIALVHEAERSNDLKRARHVLGDDMATRLNTEARSRHVAGNRVVMDGVRVITSNVVHAQRSGATDTVGARVEFEGERYVSGPDGKPVEGQTGTRRWAEEWWFTRAAQESVDSDVGLDQCPNCGAPADLVAGPQCQSCGGRLGDPSGWTLSRIAPAMSIADVFAPARARMALPLGLMISLIIAGTIAVIAFSTASTMENATTSVGTRSDDASDQFDDAMQDALEQLQSLDVDALIEEATRGISPDADPGDDYLTPVDNPLIRAPVHDVARALADVTESLGRVPTLDDIHLYEDGRIIFSVQAVDVDTGTDSITWKAGKIVSTRQGPGVFSTDDLFSPEGLDFSNLEQLCLDALGAVDIADGIIDHPYLVKVGAALRWYIPVRSESRSSNSKTYRVSMDGSTFDIF